MKNLIYILILLVISVWACNTDSVELELKEPLFCENEHKLISKFDSLPVIFSNFQSILDSIDYKLSAVYDSSYCCSKLPFCVLYHLDSDTIKIAMKYLYSCGDCTISDLSLRYNCNILLNSEGQVLFQGRILKLDSLNSKMISYYNEFDNNLRYPVPVDKLNITIQWDIDVSEANFKIFINQIINAYVEYVGTYSVEYYGKGICELNNYELIYLAQKVPLNIEIPKLEIVDINDDLEKYDL